MKSGTKQQQKLLSIASKIDGLVESVQVHSASRLLLSNDSMDVIPLYRDTECEMVSQYGIKSLEALGLIKNDNCKNLTLYQLKSIASTIVE